MQRLWVSRNLKEQWESWLREELFEKESSRLMVATAEQKKAVKNFILAERKGLMGWTILTRTEEERRLGGLGIWELEILAMMNTPKEFWDGSNKWAGEVFKWGYAGYTMSEIPFKGVWLTLSQKIQDILEINKLALGCYIELSGDIAVGFDPLECWRLREIRKLGMVAEGELSAAQQSAVSLWEKQLGEHELCDSNILPEKTVLKVSSAVELKIALKEILKAQKIKRVLYQGSAAEAALLEFSLEESDKFDLPVRAGWTQSEKLAGFCEAQEGEIIPRLEWLRLQAASAKLSWKELKIQEKTMGEAWEKNGLLREPELAAKLSPIGSLKTFKEETMPLFQEETEALLERLRPIEKLFPKEIPQELWVKMLATVKTPAKSYGGISVLPLSRAQGLIDSETVVVWSEPFPAPNSSQIEAVEVENRNKSYFTEGVELKKGFIGDSGHRALVAFKKEAAYQAKWVALAGSGAPTDIEWTMRAYKKDAKPYKSFGEIKTKHAQRMNPKAPFGENDYALPMPMRASCKQWEGIITSPELTWFELIKQKPLWRGPLEEPSALWVGNWVHEAMKEAKTLADIDAFFKNTQIADAALVWRRAHGQAWGLAREFFLALETAGAKTLAVESVVKGELVLGDEEILFSGRIDRVMQLPDGVELIVDFKTSSSASVTTEKKLQTGDGLQLWLYAKLWKPGTIAGLCRLPPEGKVSVQAEGSLELPEVEHEIARVAKTGVLGLKGDVWGRFGGEDRLPIASCPVEKKIIAARRKACNG